MEKKWQTKSIYVDNETGEIIVRQQIENGEYIKVKTTINYENNEKYQVKSITIECEQSKQKRLFL
jgi:phage antirepressor YoqD-like protein